MTISARQILGSIGAAIFVAVVALSLRWQILHWDEWTTFGLVPHSIALLTMTVLVLASMAFLAAATAVTIELAHKNPKLTIRWPRRRSVPKARVVR